MACLNLGYPKNVTVEYDDNLSCFFIYLKESCIYEFTLGDFAKELNLSFSIPFPDGEGLESTQYISVKNNQLTSIGGVLEEYLPANKERLLAAFRFMGCKTVEG